jgi:L-amino acid N-acyltransferase YncA
MRTHAVPSLDIRPATVADMAAIAAIYAPFVEAGTATFELDLPSSAEMAQRFAAITAAGYPYLAAGLGGRVVAFAYAAQFRVRPAFRYTVENSIYVASDQQRLGVGGHLLNALIDECTGRGFRQMVAVIGDSPVQGASIRLHERAGFAAAGQLDGVGFKHGQWLDVVMMQRGLGEGSRTASPGSPLVTPHARR